MISKSTVGWAAASAGLCFIGYCIYFDRKRRSDPMFKQRLREKRKKAKLAEKKKNFPVELPDLTDSEATQRFFLREIQLGEELLSRGQIEEAVEHLSVAVAVCGQATQLLAVLEQTLPPHVYTLLHEKVPSAVERIKMAGAMLGGMGMGGMPGPRGPTVTPLEDDLE